MVRGGPPIPKPSLRGGSCLPQRPRSGRCWASAQAWPLPWLLWAASLPGVLPFSTERLCGWMSPSVGHSQPLPHMPSAHKWMHSGLWGCLYVHLVVEGVPLDRRGDGPQQLPRPSTAPPPKGQGRLGWPAGRQAQGLQGN